MALPLAPLIPLLWRYGPRVLIAAKAGWVGWRLYQNKGDIGKTFSAIRDDVVHSYQFVTDAQYRALKTAGGTLKNKGGDYAALGDALLMLAEIITGTKLTSARSALKQTGSVAEAFNKLSPTAKAAVKAEVEVDIEQTLNKALAKFLYTEGLRLYNASTPLGPTAAAHLSNKYLGLYYIGRSGNHLTAEEVDTLSSDFIHFHHQIDPVRYADIIAWYTTVGVSKPANILPALLMACAEVTALDVDARYIAYALNQPIPDLDFGGMDAELKKRFKLQ